MSSGFLTLGIWIFGSLVRYFVHSTISIPYDLAELFVLAVMACTPTIWIGRNKQIFKDFVSYFRRGISPNNSENSFGGVWIGP